MDYNFHTHTYRCGHASGREEEYVLKAIENGIKYMGFSDHIPLMFDDGFESGYRVHTDKAKDYVGEINRLKEKYKDKIKIFVGFESEYYQDFFDNMIENAIDYGAEYFILGQHFLSAEHPNGIPSGRRTENIEDLKKYVDTVIKAMKTGTFTYVAHPDIINFTGDDEAYKEEMRKMCKAALDLQIPLEINFLGIRDNRHYPNPLFWEVAGEVGAPVTFGFDAHETQVAFDGESLIKAKEMVKSFGLSYIGKPKIKFLKDVKR